MPELIVRAYYFRNLNVVSETKWQAAPSSFANIPLTLYGYPAKNADGPVNTENRI
jgi:hypothetical protein